MLVNSNDSNIGSLNAEAKEEVKLISQSKEHKGILEEFKGKTV